MGVCRALLWLKHQLPFPHFRRHRGRKTCSIFRSLFVASHSHEQGGWGCAGCERSTRTSGLQSLQVQVGKKGPVSSLKKNLTYQLLSSMDTQKGGHLPRRLSFFFSFVLVFLSPLANDSIIHSKCHPSTGCQVTTKMTFCIFRLGFFRT